jgi:hypothetical protein
MQNSRSFRTRIIRCICLMAAYISISPLSVTLAEEKLTSSISHLTGNEPVGILTSTRSNSSTEHKISQLPKSSLMKGVSSFTSPETYRNVATGLCLDSNSNRYVYTRSCNSGSYQKWNVSTSGSARIFRNVATGYCLDSNANRNVYTRRCNGGSYQKWSITRSGSYLIFKNVATGLCLDSNTSRYVYTRVCNGGSYQKWR